MKMRSKVLVVGAVAATLTIGGTAYAYWSSNGSGTGTGNVANVASGDIVLAGQLDGDLYPGGTQHLDVTVANSSSSAIRIGAVSATVTVKDASDNDITSLCQITVTPYSQNTDVAANQTATALASLAVTMANDSGQNQDACKGATITFALSSADPT